MKKSILIFTAILVVTACLSGCGPAPLTEAEAINVINTFDAGWNKKNLHVVDSVLAPGYSYFTQSGSIFSRDSVVATAGENTYSLSDVSRTEFVVSLVDDVAIVSTRWKEKGCTVEILSTKISVAVLL